MRKRLFQVPQYFGQASSAEGQSIAILKKYVFSAVQQPGGDNIITVLFLRRHFAKLRVESFHIPAAVRTPAPLCFPGESSHTVNIFLYAVHRVSAEFRMPVKITEFTFVPGAPLRHLHQKAVCLAGRANRPDSKWLHDLVSFLTYLNQKRGSFHIPPRRFPLWSAAGQSRWQGCGKCSAAYRFAAPCPDPSPARDRPISWLPGYHG